MKKIAARTLCFILMIFCALLPFSFLPAFGSLKTETAPSSLPETRISASIVFAERVHPFTTLFFADTEQGIPAFVRVRTRNVYFYSSPSTITPLFALIPTYYLKVTGAEGSFWQVEVLEGGDYHTKLAGYVLASAVESVFTVPDAPLYPQLNIKVETSSATVYSAPSSTSAVLVTALSAQNMGYYGKIITSDREWYYVYFKGYMGYVDAANVSAPLIVNHPTPLSEEGPIDIIDEPNPPDPNEIKDLDSLQLALILLIAIPSVIIIIVVITPSKKFQNKKPATYDYAEETPQDAAQTLTTDKKPKYYDDFI